MMRRYPGPAGEYLWDKEMQRLERYKDQPWELERQESRGKRLLVQLLIGQGMLAGLLLLSFF